MKLVNFKILALLVVTYSVALVAMTPLTWLLPYMEPSFAAAGVRLTNVEGSLWQGRGVVTQKSVGNLNVDWDVNVLSLLLLKAPVDVHASNSALDLTGQLIISPFNVAISNVSGYVDEVAAKAIYQPYRADIKGRLQLNNVSAKTSWGLELGDASGELTWSGGPISIPVGRSSQTFEVPTMLGVISSDEEQWQALVRGTSEQTYIIASLSKAGLGTLSIKRELASEMNIPVPGNGSSLFDISQQVF